MNSPLNTVNDAGEIVDNEKVVVPLSLSTCTNGALGSLDVSGIPSDDALTDAGREATMQGDNIMGKYPRSVFVADSKPSDLKLRNEEKALLVDRLQSVLGTTSKPTFQQVIGHLFAEASPLYKQVFSLVFKDYKAFLRFMVAFFLQRGCDIPSRHDAFRYILQTDQGRIDLSRITSVEEYTDAWEMIGQFRFEDGEWLWQKLEAALNQVRDELYNFGGGGSGFYTKNRVVSILSMDTCGMKRFRDNDGERKLLCHETAIKNVAVRAVWERTSDLSGQDCRSRLLEGVLEDKENSSSISFRYSSLEEDVKVKPDSEEMEHLIQTPMNDGLPHLPSNTAQARVVACMLLQSIYNVGVLQALSVSEDPAMIAVVCLKKLYASQS